MIHCHFLIGWEMNVEDRAKLWICKCGEWWGLYGFELQDRTHGLDEKSRECHWKHPLAWDLFVRCYVDTRSSGNIDFVIRNSVSSMHFFISFNKDYILLRSRLFQTVILLKFCWQKKSHCFISFKLYNDMIWKKKYWNNATLRCQYVMTIDH